jgi:alkylation response protein AidB-like acyl-CoA dehydrogenase
LILRFSMDFSLTKDQADIRKAATEFAKGAFEPDLILEWDHKQEFPGAIWRKACDLGFVGAHFPEAYGGQGLDFLDQALILEAFCRRDSGVGIALGLSDFGSEMVFLHGTEAQKTRVLPSITRGDGYSTMAFLEEGYGLSPFQTEVRKRGGLSFIQGTKSHVPLAGTAGFMVIVCQAGREPTEGQSVFLVENRARGLEYSPEGETLGMRMISLGKVHFEMMEVLEENRIGEVGKGASYLKECLRHVRVELGAMALGIAQGALDRALDYAGKREQFGKAIVRFHPVRNRLADMFTRVETARQMVYRAAWSLGRERPDEGAAIMAKLVASRTALGVSSDAIQIHGGYGYMTEGQVEHYYRDAKALGLFLESAPVEENMLADLIPWRF